MSWPCTVPTTDKNMAAPMRPYRMEPLEHLGTTLETMRNFTIASLVSCALASPITAQHPTADGAMQTFNTLSEQYFQQVYFKFSPTAGTSAGLHQYDPQLEDYSAAGVQKEIAALHEWEKKIAAVDPSALDAEPAADRDILLNSIRGQLLQLEVIRGWEK